MTDTDPLVPLLAEAEPSPHRRDALRGFLFTCGLAEGPTEPERADPEPGVQPLNAIRRASAATRP